MIEKSFKYEVAFSFLAEDEDLVNQINDLLKGRLSTFVYSERQAEIAGTDGEKTFNRVFGSDARIVVVLYREKWGNTHWTRIEETAIRNRAYEEGYDFTLFIPLDPKHPTPQWLPKTQLWFGIEQWGIQGAASAIETKVEQSGGAVKELTAVEQAAILAHEVAEKERKKEFVNSNEGVAAANNEIADLFALVEQLSEKLTDQSIIVDCSWHYDECVVFSKGLSLVLIWLIYHTNSLDSSTLLVQIRKGKAIVGGRYNPMNPTPPVLAERRFKFGIDRGGIKGWMAESDPKTFRTTRQLADHLMKDFINRLSASLLSS